jgi:hypothetical protein
MADYQVTCIDKPSHDSSYVQISHLGSRGWRWTQNAVMDAITEKTNTFYIVIAGRRHDIGIANGSDGEHVQSHAEGEWDDELLRLPGCSGYL